MRKIKKYSRRFSNEFYHKLFASAYETHLLISTGDGKILLANNAAEKMFGVSIDEITGSELSRFCSSGDLALREKFSPVLTAEPILEEIVIETSVLNNKGVFLPVEASVLPVSGTKSGNMFLLKIRDISRKKMMESALQDKIDELNTILNISQDLIGITDFQGNIFRVNSQWEKVLGYRENDLIGRYLTDFVHKADCALLITNMQAAGGKLPVGEFIIRCPDRDKKTHWFECRFGTSSELLYFTLRDITRRIKTENELIKARDKAEESDRLKSAFLANMSHEIRTPMNGIIGFSDMLTDRSISEDERISYSDIIMKSSRQLLAIVDNVLDYSKIEAGVMALKEYTFNINELINDFQRFYQPAALEKKLKFDCHSDLSDEQSYIRSDQMKIRQILSNLLNNAFKFTESGFVTLTCQIAENKMVLSVKDSGIGMDKDFMKVLFTPFRQASHSGNKYYSGTGLGLSICKAYTEAMGGRLQAVSEIRQGSFFNCILPYNPVADINRESQPGKYGKLSKSDPVILIVEDEDINYMYLSSALKQFASRIYHARSGKEALELFGAHRDIRLVFMDIKLSDMNGYEVTKKIREIDPDVKIIAQTAYAMADEKQNALDSGCNDYLAKPFRLNELYMLTEKYS